MKYRQKLTAWRLFVTHSSFFELFLSIIFMDSFNFIDCCKDNVFVFDLINILSESSRIFVTNCKVKIILTKLSMVKYEVTIYDNVDE